MKRFIFSLLAFFVAISCTESIDEHSNTGGIAGVVADKTTGEPVPVVNVKLEESGASTVTGSDGSFSFQNLTAGTYTILISKEGYKDNTTSVKVSGGSITDCHLLIERIPAVLTIDRESLDFGDNYSNTTLSFSMVNKNYIDLDWEIVYSCRWIKEIDPIKSIAKLGYGKTQTVVVIIDRDALQPGNNETVIVVRTTDGASELSVKATGQEKRLASLNIEETTDIKASSAILNAVITDEGVPAYFERGFVLGDSEMPTKETAIKVIPAAVNSEKKYAARAGDLVLGGTYYVRAYATNSLGTAYSTNQDKFSTVAVLPTVATFNATSEDRETKTAVLRGSILFEGDPTYKERGFVWSTAYENPSIEENKIVVTGSGVGDFERRETFPDISQTIYVRAYATNQRGTAYGESVKIFLPAYISLNSIKLGVQRKDINGEDNAVTWETANSLCINSDIGNCRDWRLPTYDELYQLYNLKESIGGFHTDPEYYTAVGLRYWSSSKDMFWGGTAWGWRYPYIYVDFSDGSNSYYDDRYSTGYAMARCVRSLE